MRERTSKYRLIAASHENCETAKACRPTILPFSVSEFNAPMNCLQELAGGSVVIVDDLPRPQSQAPQSPDLLHGFLRHRQR